MSGVIKCLAETAQSLPESVDVNWSLVGIVDDAVLHEGTTTDIFMLLAGALSEKLSILTDLHNCFDQLGLRDLAIIILIHGIVLSLE